jgi:RimJ/RimL family protein N-acetyltransferase
MLQSGFLRGKKTYLSAFRDEDISKFAAWYDDMDFLRNLDAVPSVPRTKSYFEDWVKEKGKSHDGYLFAIRATESDEVIGMIELDGILWNQQISWLAIAIGDAQYRGLGLGRDATETVLQFAFDELNLRRIQLTVFAYNEPAIRLYEDLGFQKEGVYREFLHRDGNVYDMYLYGLLRREWRGR